MLVSIIMMLGTNRRYTVPFWDRLLDLHVVEATADFDTETLLGTNVAGQWKF
jgi:hypothetical protein